MTKAPSSGAGEQMHRFGQNRFTHEQRRLQFIDPFDGMDY
jgi:hypothetical protein